MHSPRISSPLLAAVTLSLFFLITPSVICEEETPTTTISIPTSTSDEPPTTTTETLPPTTSSLPLTTTAPLPPIPSPSESVTVPISISTKIISDKDDGGYNSPCNSTSDCLKDFACTHGTCHCQEPMVFELHEERCVIPLGQSCDSSDLEHEDTGCPMFAECFMDRCVCKEHYHMHTMTHCKSDLAGMEEPRKTVLWPRPQSAGAVAASTNHIIAKAVEEEVCSPENCDETKGLVCHGDTCQCRNSRDLFVEEFGLCLNSTLQDSLREALNVMDGSEDEIKTFAKTLEKIDDAEHEAHGSTHYNSPVHQLVRLFGEDEEDDVIYRRDSTAPSESSKVSQVAPPSKHDDGDLYSAAQEPAPESTVPGSSPSSPYGPPPSRRGPISFGHSEDDSEEPISYKSEEASQLFQKPQRRLALDNLEPQTYNQEPHIHQRQAPAYYHQGNHDIPLQGLGVIPQGSNHYTMPYGGHGGHGGLFGGHHGLGDHGLGHHGLGGHGGFGHHGLGHLGGHHGGLGHGGLGLGQLVDARHPGLGGHVGGAAGGGEGENEDLFRRPHFGFGGPGRGVFGRGPGGPGGGGGEGGGGGGPGGGGGGRKSLLVDLGEFIAKSLRLVDRFLPLIHAVNDVIKRRGPGGGGGGRRFGESSKEELIKEPELDELKAAQLFEGIIKFIGMLMRLRKRLSAVGDEAIKKLMA